ncbi:MAG: S24 family peptidase [Hyphomicrobium sp.]|uniref:S24 family peptidase n=1 Tax=Hyphomicrobium sp. TaxID=82 RepID=UPI003D0961A0
MTEISPAARRLKQLREEAGLAMREVAEALDWPLTRYQHYEDRYRRAHLPLDFMRALAPIFESRGVPAAELLALAGLADSEIPRSARQRRMASSAVAGGAVGSRDLPVLGAVKGGAEGFYFNEGEAKEYLVRPPTLDGVANGFALYVEGESMEPRYFAGEILYVNPNRPITRNCFVAVELADGQGMIKQFLKRSDEHVMLHQFNPPKDIRVPVENVKRIYRITGASELG